MTVVMIEKQVSLPKESAELAEGVKKFVMSMKAALADGWQPGQDLPVMLSSAMTDLVPAMQGVEQIPAEFTEKKLSVAKAFAIAGIEIAEVL